MSSRHTTDYRIISRGVEMLRRGTLPSVLPERLRDEFGLTPERAHKLAASAIELHKKPGKRGKLDTEPFDKLD